MTEKSEIMLLFTPSGCLSSEGIKRYLEGSLDGSGKKMAELHLDTCELCADAVGGYRFHHTQAGHVPGHHDLNRRLHQRFLSVQPKKRRERSMISLFSVAATVILLTGLFYLLKQKEIYREKYLAESIHDTVMSHSVSSLAPEPKQESDAQAIIDPGRPVSVKGKAFQPMGESASVNATVHGHYGSDTAADERDLRDEAKLPDAEARVVESHSDEDTAEMNNGGKSPFFPESEKTVSAVENPATEDAAISPDELMTGKEAESGDDQVFVVVEDMPTFMNGDISKFIAYVNKSLVYPPRALEAGTEGKVMVRFIVDENGKLIQPEVIGPSDPLLRQEALRVLSSSPRWNAGKQRGKPVKVAFTIPVIFSLEEKKPD